MNGECGIILSSNESSPASPEIAYLINFNDHLQIICFNNNKKIDYRKCFEVLDDKLAQISKKLEFDYSDEYGYLTSCVSNCGEACKITTGLNIPNLSKNGNFVFLLNEWDFIHKFNSATENSNSAAVNELYSKHKFGIEKNVFINSYIIKICSLLNYEDKLEQDANYKFPTLSELALSKKLKSLYNSHLRSLRFIVSPHNKDFYSIFKLDKLSKRYSLSFQDKESYIIYKNLISDYIAEKTNVSMNVKKSEEINKKILEASKEQLTSASLGKFATLIRLHAKENLSKAYFIERRNLKNFNFSNSLSKKKSALLNDTLAQISQEILNANSGKIIESEHLQLLSNSNFALLLDEINEFNNNNLYPNRKVFAYMNNDDTLLVLFNAEDQIKIILSIDQPEKLLENFLEFTKIQDLVKNYVNLDQYFGYLTTNPCNSGSSFEVRLSFNNKDKKYSDEIKTQMRNFLLSRTNCAFATKFDVFNKIKANFSKNEILENVNFFLDKILSQAFKDELEQEKKKQAEESLNPQQQEEELEVNTEKTQQAEQTEQVEQMLDNQN